METGGTGDKACTYYVRHSYGLSGQYGCWQRCMMPSMSSVASVRLSWPPQRSSFQVNRTTRSTSSSSSSSAATLCEGWGACETRVEASCDGWRGASWRAQLKDVCKAYYHRGLRRWLVSVPDMGAGRRLVGRDMRGTRRVQARMVGVDNDPGEGKWHGGREGEIRMDR